MHTKCLKVYKALPLRRQVRCTFWEKKGVDAGFDCTCQHCLLCVNNAEQLKIAVLAGARLPTAS